jgi:hypothetical protein
MFCIDPRSKEYSWQSPYVYHRNNPVLIVDYLGGGDDDLADGDYEHTDGTVDTYEQGKLVAISGEDLSKQQLEEYGGGITDGTLKEFGYKNVGFEKKGSLEKLSFKNNELGLSGELVAGAYKAQFTTITEDKSIEGVIEIEVSLAEGNIMAGDKDNYAKAEFKYATAGAKEKFKVAWSEKERGGSIEVDLSAKLFETAGSGKVSTSYFSVEAKKAGVCAVCVGVGGGGTILQNREEGTILYEVKGNLAAVVGIEADLGVQINYQNIRNDVQDGVDWLVNYYDEF